MLPLLLSSFLSSVASLQFVFRAIHSNSFVCSLPTSCALGRYSCLSNSRINYPTQVLSPVVKSLHSSLYTHYSYFRVYVGIHLLKCSGSLSTISKSPSRPPHYYLLFIPKFYPPLISNNVFHSTVFHSLHQHQGQDRPPPRLMGQLLRTAPLVQGFHRRQMEGNFPLRHLHPQARQPLLVLLHH